MTIDRVWIGNCIYWTLTQNVTTLYKPLSPTDWCSQSWSSLCCLVAASNGGRSLFSEFPNRPWLQLPAATLNWLTACRLSWLADRLIHRWAGGYLTTTSYSSGSWSALYSLGMDTTGNTSPNCSSVVAWRSYWHETRRKHLLSTVTPLLCVTQPSPSNGCFSGSTVLAFSIHAILLLIFQV
jgi:hypothetical protein